MAASSIETFQCIRQQVAEIRISSTEPEIIFRNLSPERKEIAKRMETKSQTQESAVEFCKKTIEHFEKKADHNKKESLGCFILVIVSTLAVPVFITLGPGLLLGKIVPSVLSLIAAGATSWLQLRKPQQLWATYRTAQRQLEDHQTKYHFQIGEYVNSEDPDKTLAEHVAKIKLNTHEQWVLLVPSPDNLKGLQPEQQSADTSSTKP